MIYVFVMSLTTIQELGICHEQNDWNLFINRSARSLPMLSAQHKSVSINTNWALSANKVKLRKYKLSSGNYSQQQVKMIGLWRFQSDKLLIRIPMRLSSEGRKEMFYLTTHSTHFIYGYMASDIW